MDLWHSKGKNHGCLHKRITPSLVHCRSSEAIKRSSGNGIELDWKTINWMSLWGVCESRGSVLDLKHNENWETGATPCVITLHCCGTTGSQNTFNSIKVLNILWLMSKEQREVLLNLFTYFKLIGHQSSMFKCPFVLFQEKRKKNIHTQAYFTEPTFGNSYITALWQDHPIHILRLLVQTPEYSRVSADN